MKSPRPDVAGALVQASTDKRIDILRRLDAAGSISEAARGAGVSYKAAWQALETLNNLAGTPLVAKAVGGAGGGGARLTAAGRQVLAGAALLAQSRAAVLGRLQTGAARAAPAPAGSAAARSRGTPAPASGLGPGPGLAALALRTSLRNQLPCTVTGLRAQAGLVRVGLVLPGGVRLWSRVTRESSQLLGLAAGMPLLALFKATAVQLVDKATPSEGHNLLPGRLSGRTPPPRGGEATLRLEGGLGLVGFAAAGHGLRSGQPAVAVVAESAVVLALAG